MHRARFAANPKLRPGRKPTVSYDFRSDPFLGSALEYWESKCGDRAMPRRKDIEPGDMRYLLPHIQITELVDDGKRVRYRLIGTAIVDAYGADFTGKYFDEVITPGRLRIVEENYRAMCCERRPLFVYHHYRSTKCAELVCARLMMPLSEDDIVVNQCLTAMSFHHPGQMSQWFGDWGFAAGSEVDNARSYTQLV
jgi:hypothetical protein